LAEVYWQHQRDEGEPVFSEFLGLLDDPGTSELAVDLVEEFETLGDIDRSLTDALALLRQSGERAERDKLLAELRRTNATAHGPATGNADDDLLRQLQEKARTPDLRRVGG
jgi:hypothetical protein